MHPNIQRFSIHKMRFVVSMWAAAFLVVARTDCFCAEPAASQPDFYTNPATQPETPTQLLQRLKPRLEHDAAVEQMESEIKKVTIPAIDFHETPFHLAVDQINDLIRLHNAQPNRFQIPRVKLEPCLFGHPPEAEGPHPVIPGLDSADATAAHSVPISEARITLKLPNGLLMQVMNYISSLVGTHIEIEPDAIWITPLTCGGQMLITRSYIVPEVIFSNRKQVEDYLQYFGLAGPTLPHERTWSFAQNFHVLMLRNGKGLIDAFEIWYAHELLKHGYTLVR